MKITIFKRLTRRLKRWLGHVEFLGRARREAARRLTLPDLEREVRAHMGVALTAKSRPPRFVALRYALFGAWGLAPWITEDAIQEFDKEFWRPRNPNDRGMPSSTSSRVFLTAALIGIPLWLIAGIEQPIALIGCISGIAGAFFYLINTLVRLYTAGQFVASRKLAWNSESTQATIKVPVSEAIARYVAHRLDGVKEGVVGKKTVHAKTRERADGELREARASWTQLHLRICQRYGEGISDDASVELTTDEQVPAHLRVLREELRLILRRAEDTLHQLDKFESNITAALDELGAEARADLVLYEDLDLIEGVRRLGGRVEQTARDTRRSIAQGLDAIQERMDALREDVLRREELIGSVVAALPDAPDRAAQWKRLEDAVSGLSAPPRQKTLA